VISGILSGGGAQDGGGGGSSSGGGGGRRGREHAPLRAKTVAEEEGAGSDGEEGGEGAGVSGEGGDRLRDVGMSECLGNVVMDVGL